MCEMNLWMDSQLYYHFNIVFNFHGTWPVIIPRPVKGTQQYIYALSVVKQKDDDNVAAFLQYTHAYSFSNFHEIALPCEKSKNQAPCKKPASYTVLYTLVIYIIIVATTQHQIRQTNSIVTKPYESIKQINIFTEWILFR